MNLPGAHPGPPRAVEASRLRQFLAQECAGHPLRLLLVAGASGVANGLLLALVNLAATPAAAQQLAPLLLGAFIATLAVAVLGRRSALRTAATLVEDGLLRLRLRLLDKLRRTELRRLETAGGRDLLASLQQFGAISEAVVPLVAAAQSTLVIAVIGLYLAWLSLASLVAVAAIFGTILPLLIAYNRRTRAGLRLAAGRDAAFFDGFGGMLAGFKALKLEQPQADGVFGELRRHTRAAFRLRRSCGQRQASGVNLAHSMGFGALAVAVFLVPALDPAAAVNVHQVAAAILFLLAPVANLATAVPILARVDAAFDQLYAFETWLDDGAGDREARTAVVALRRFTRISFHGVTFRFTEPGGETRFRLAPFDLTLSAGELVFIVGGNGSGKSTLLKLLTGLYRPDDGQVILDDRPVGRGDWPRYRSLFSCVFTDFHLFQRLYGLPELAPAAVNRQLADLGLAHKTRYTGAGFTDLDLSTGQRKRIAFIAAVLKGRPICVFDELAADQDPDFRRRFYEELLPDLRQAGRTVLVVSHDERWFPQADRVIVLRNGRVGYQ